MSAKERLKSWLESPRGPAAVALVAAVLAGPSLVAGLQTEDHIHREIARTAAGAPNLFGGPATVMQNYALKDAGYLPWITEETWRIAFWRPLSSWTHTVDYTVWPDLPWLMHAHSLAWLAGLVGIAALLYRRLETSPLVAGLAGLFYAIDDGHGPAVGWLANRSAVIATAFAVLAIWAHDRWRRDGWKAGAFVGPVALWLALASGELAVGAVGYFVAHALCIDRASVPRRVLAQLPWLATVCVWAVPYRLLGFGARASGAYVDPLGDPVGYLEAVAHRLPLLAHGLFSAPSTDFVVVLERWHSVFLAVGAALGVLAIAGLVPVLRQSATARFWALGAGLSMLPACTAMPSDRMLFLPGIGGMALVATVVARWLFGGLPERGAERVVATALAAVWLAVHGLGAAVLLPYRSLGVRKHDDWVRSAEGPAFAGVARRDQQLVIVNAPDFYTGTLLLGVRNAEKKLVPHHVRVLYGGDEPVRLTRHDARTVLVRPARGFLMPKMNTVYRSSDHPMRVGQGLQLTGLQIVVQEVDDEGAPLAATFRFEQPLESDALVWVAWNGETYVPFEPPRSGRTVEVPPIEFELF